LCPELEAMLQFELQLERGLTLALLQLLLLFVEQLLLEVLEQCAAVAAAVAAAAARLTEDDVAATCTCTCCWRKSFIAFVLYPHQTQSHNCCLLLPAIKEKKRQ